MLRLRFCWWRGVLRLSCHWVRQAPPDHISGCSSFSMTEKRKPRKSPHRDNDRDYARLKAMPPFGGEDYWEAQRRSTADNAAKRLREIKLEKAAGGPGWEPK